MDGGKDADDGEDIQPVQGQRYSQGLSDHADGADGSHAIHSARVGSVPEASVMASTGVDRLSVSTQQQSEGADEAKLTKRPATVSRASEVEFPSSVSKVKSGSSVDQTADESTSELADEMQSNRKQRVATDLDMTTQQIHALTMSENQVQQMEHLDHLSCSHSQLPGHGDKTASLSDTAHWIVTYNQLQSLSFKIASQWQKVASSLKPDLFDRQVVNQIASQHPDNLQRQALAMLEKWWEKHDRQCAVDVMCEILINAGCRAEAENTFGSNLVHRVRSQMSDTDSEDITLQLYELAVKVGADWKELAVQLGLTHQINAVEMEAHTTREQAWKMLEKWHSMMGSNFSTAMIRGIQDKLAQIQKKQYTSQLQNLIFPKNLYCSSNMCGREKEIKIIANGYWEQDVVQAGIDISKFCLQIINGMGGVGKSALAARYAALYKEMYGDGVFHFSVESWPALHMSIRQNLRMLGMHFSEDGVFGGVVDDNELFLQHVYGRSKVLLMYDGADDLDLLEKMLPTDSTLVHVLVTTRMSADHPILARADRVVSLGRLGAAAGVEALQAWRGCAGQQLEQEEMKFAKRLVSESPIEGLPLAIAHVGTFMRKAQVSYQQYYQLLSSEEEELQALALDLEKLLNYFKVSRLLDQLMLLGVSRPSDLSKLRPEDVDSIAASAKDKCRLLMARHFSMNSKHVHLTWQLDIQTVKETDSSAMLLLVYASLMDCKRIPERVLRPLVFSDAPAHRYSLSVTTLTSHSLVDVSDSNEGYSFDMHPLVHSTVLEHVIRQPEEFHSKLTSLCNFLLRLLPQYNDRNIKRSLKDDQLISLIPHVYAAAEKALWVYDDDMCVSLVNIACKISLISQHVDVAARLCHERLKATGVSATIKQRCLALYDMGLALQQMIKPQDAQMHFVKALQLIENSGESAKVTMVQEHRLVLGQLAACYEQQEMFVEAQGLYEALLLELNERPETDKRDIAVAMNNLAYNYSKSGQLQQALDTYKQLLEMKSADAPTEPLSFAITLANLGHCLMETGQYEQSLPMLEKSVSISRECLPGDHLDMAEGLRNLSSCYKHLGDVRKSIQLCEEAVAIASHCLPTQHPRIAVYLSQLASCYHKAGDLDSSIRLTGQCVPILKQNLPSTRSDLCTALNNLGLYYSEKGMVNEAIVVLEECLVAERSFLAPSHPSVGTTLWNLGSAYFKREDCARATELFRECLSIRENCLPATHPGVIAVLWELGDIALIQQQYAESLQMYRRLHDTLCVTFPKSEDMATVCDNMGICYVKLAKLNDAEVVLTESLRIRTATYPAGHDKIVASERWLRQVWQLKFGQ